MATSTKTSKAFDAVRFMWEQRERVSKVIEHMTAEEELAYFKKKSEEFRKTIS